MGFFDSKPNDVVAEGIIRDFGDVPGVGGVVDGYLALVESEFINARFLLVLMVGRMLMSRILCW